MEPNPFKIKFDRISYSQKILKNNCIESRKLNYILNILYNKKRGSLSLLK